MMSCRNILAVLIVALSLAADVWSIECSALHCIRNLEDMIANFKCDRSSMSDRDKSIFRFATIESVEEMNAVYHNISLDNSTGRVELDIDSSSVVECCDPSHRENCKVTPRKCAVQIFLRSYTVSAIRKYLGYCTSPSKQSENT